MRVLIAEDDDASRLALQRAIEGMGHECVAAIDGDEAWRLYRGSDPDAIVSDWIMPGIEGDELCRRVKAAPDAPFTYFILLTSLKDSAIEAMEAGADDYLIKPYDLQDLRARLIAAERVTALHRRLRAQQSGRTSG